MEPTSKAVMQSKRKAIDELIPAPTRFGHLFGISAASTASLDTSSQQDVLALDTASLDTASLDTSSKALPVSNYRPLLGSIDLHWGRYVDDAFEQHCSSRGSNSTMMKEKDCKMEHHSSSGSTPHVPDTQQQEKQAAAAAARPSTSISTPH
jgi:hypothetical protein